MPPVAMGAQLVGSAMSAMAANQAGQDQAAYYGSLASSNYAEAAETKAVADRNIGSTQMSASEESARIGRQGEQVGAAQQAGEAANGIIGGTTRQALAQDTFNKNQLDQMLIRYNADAKSSAIANGANFRVSQLKNQAGYYGTAALNADQAGQMNAMATLLGGAAQAGGQWGKYSMGGGGWGGGSGGSSWTGYDGGGFGGSYA